MFSKKKASPLDRAEDSPSAQSLQRLAEELEPSAKYRQELEERLRRFTNQPIAQAQPLLSAKGFRLKGAIMSSYNQADSRQLGRRGLLGGLGLMVALAVGLLAWVYLYTPPALPIAAQPSVPGATTSVPDTTEEEECQQHKISGVDCIIYFNQLFNHVQWPAFSQKLNSVQSAKGYTLTVQRVYADANNIYIGYELDGPNGQLYRPKLSLVEGDKEQELGIYGIDQMNLSGKGSTGIAIYADGLPLNIVSHNVIQLRWKVLEIDAVRPFDPRTSPPPDASLANPYAHITANMAFDLNIPVTPGQQINLNRQDGGATLQKVIITPSEIRFFLTGTGESIPYAQLTRDGVKADRGRSIRQPDGLTILGFDNPFPQDDQSHQFVLNVQPGKLDTWNPITRINHMLAGGPWSFQFQLP